MKSNAGYIKVSRRLRDHWLWQGDSERLKWWLDLLFMAAWEDTRAEWRGRFINIRRGQMIASYVFLSQRWHRDVRTVKRFLMLLEEAGMLHNSMYVKIRILTICNYDSYQSDAAAVMYPPMHNPMQDKMSNEVRDRTTDQTHTEMHTIKEINNINTTAASARAHEESDFLKRFLSPEKLSQRESLREELRVTRDWIESWARRIFEEWRLANKRHKDYSDFARHLLSVLRKVAEKEKKGPRESQPRKMARAAMQAVDMIINSPNSNPDVKF